MYGYSKKVLTRSPFRGWEPSICALFVAVRSRIDTERADLYFNKSAASAPIRALFSSGGVKAPLGFGASISLVGILRNLIRGVA